MYWKGIFGPLMCRLRIRGHIMLTLFCHSILMVYILAQVMHIWSLNTHGIYILAQVMYIWSLSAHGIYTCLGYVYLVTQCSGYA